MTFNARNAWKRTYRETRLMGRGNGATARQWGIILACSGATSGRPSGSVGRFCYKVQALLQANDRVESDRYERTRTVLNSFGRLNPWRCFTPSEAKRRDSQRVRALRSKLLAKRLIAPEPGGYVTGLLSHAPEKMWWVDYPWPVAAPSRDDVELFEGRRAAA